MSTVIDENVVKMSFDNERFEKNISKTMDSIDKLKSKLFFKNDGFDNFQKSAEQSLGAVEVKFSALEAVALSTIQNITNRAIDAGAQLVKSLSVDNIATGWEKFGNKTISVGTLISQGYDMKTVNEQLDKLNWYTDETSYNFTDMVNNISKFTAVGQDLETSVTAMMGIANWAAVSGQNASTASRAMYQLSQAMGAGVMRLEDYKSIQNVSMNTDEFQQKALDAAVALGTLKKNADNTYQSLVGASEKFTKSQFTTMLTQGRWFTSDVMMEVFKQYGSAVEPLYNYYLETGETASEAFEALAGEIDEFGEKTFKAAQEARTFGDVIDSVKDAVSTGWMVTFENIFGNYEQAKVLWTKLANELYDIFAEGGNERNEILTAWNEAGGRLDLLQSLWNLFHNLVNIINEVKEAFSSVFTPITSERLLTITSKFKEFTENIYLGSGQLEFLKTTFEGFFSAISIAIKFVKAVGTGIVSAFTPFNEAGYYVEAFIYKIAKALINADDKFDSLKIVEIIATNLKNIFEQGTKIFPLFVGAVSMAASQIYTIFKRIGNVLATIIGNVFGVDVGNDFQKFLDEVDGFVTGVFDIISDPDLTSADKIEKVFNLIGDSLSSIIANSGTAFDDFSTIGERVGDAISGMAQVISTYGSTVIDFIVNDIPAAIETLGTVSGSILQAIKLNVLDKIGEHLVKLASFFSEELESDPDSFYNWLMALISLVSQGGAVYAIIVGAIAFATLSEAFNLLAQTFSGSISIVSDAIRAMREGIAGFSSSTATILALVAAVIVLGSIDRESLAQGIVALTFVFSIYKNMAKELTSLSTNITKLKNMKIVMQYLSAFSASTLALAISMRIISFIDMDNLLGDLLAITTFLVGLVHSFKFISKTLLAIRDIEKVPIKLLAIAGMMSMISSAILILTLGMKVISDIDDPMKVTQSWGVIMGFIGGIIGVIYATSIALTKAKRVKKFGTNILFVSALLSSFTLAVSVILKGVSELVKNADASVNYGSVTLLVLGIMSGVVGVITLLVFMAEKLSKMTATINLSGVEKALSTLSTSALFVSLASIIASVGVAAKLLSMAIVDIGNLDAEAAVRGLKGLVVVMNEIIIVILALNLFPKDLSSSFALISIGIMLNMMAVILEKLGELDPWQYEAVLGELLIIFTEIAGFFGLLRLFGGDTKVSAQAMLIISGALLGLSLAFKTMDTLNKPLMTALLLTATALFAGRIATAAPALATAANGLYRLSASLLVFSGAITAATGAIMLIGSSGDLWTKAEEKIAKYADPFREAFVKICRVLLIGIAEVLIDLVNILGISLMEAIYALGRILVVYVGPIGQTIIDILIGLVNIIDKNSDALVDSIVQAIYDIFVDILEKLADLIINDGDRLLRAALDLVEALYLLVAKCFGADTDSLRRLIDIGRQEIEEGLKGLPDVVKVVLYTISTLLTTFFTAKLIKHGAQTLVTSISKVFSNLNIVVTRFFDNLVGFYFVKIVPFFQGLVTKIQAIFQWIQLNLTGTQLMAIGIYAAVIIATYIFRDEIAQALVETFYIISGYIQYLGDQIEAFFNRLERFGADVYNALHGTQEDIIDAQIEASGLTFDEYLDTLSDEERKGVLRVKYGTDDEKVVAWMREIEANAEYAQTEEGKIEKSREEIYAMAKAMAYTEGVAADYANGVSASSEGAADQIEADADKIAEAEKKKQEWLDKAADQNAKSNEKTVKSSEKTSKEIADHAASTVTDIFDKINQKAPWLQEGLSSLGTNLMKTFGLDLSTEGMEAFGSGLFNFQDNVTDTLNENFDGEKVGEEQAKKVKDGFWTRWFKFDNDDDRKKFQKTEDETIKLFADDARYKIGDVYVTDETIDKAIKEENARRAYALQMTAEYGGRNAVSEEDKKWYTEYLVGKLRETNPDATLKDLADLMRKANLFDDKDIEVYTEDIVTRAHKDVDIIEEVTDTVVDEAAEKANAILGAADQLSQRQSEAKSEYDKYLDYYQNGIIDESQLKLLTDVWLNKNIDIYSFCVDYMNESLDNLENQVIRDAKKAYDKQESAKSVFNEYLELFENEFLDESTFMQLTNALVAKYPGLMDYVSEQLMNIEDSIVKRADKSMDAITNIRNKISHLFDLYGEKVISKTELDSELERIKNTYPEYVDVITTAIEDGFDSFESEVLKSAKRIEDRISSAESRIKDVLDLYSKNRMSPDEVRRELKPYIEQFGDDPYFMEDVYEMLDAIEDEQLQKAKQLSSRRNDFIDEFKELVDLYNDGSMELDVYDRLSRELIGKYSDLDSEWMRNQIHDVFESLDNERLEEAEKMFDTLYEQYQNGLVEWEDFQKKYTTLLKNYSDKRIQINKYAVDKMSEDGKNSLQTIFDLFNQGLLSNQGFSEQIDKMRKESLDDGVETEKQLINLTEDYLSESVTTIYDTYKNTLKQISDDIEKFADNLRISLSDVFKIEIADEGAIQESADSFADKMHTSFGDMFVSKTNKEIYDEKLEKMNNELDDAVSKWGSGSLKVWYYKREIAKVQDEYDKIVKEGKENDIGKTTFGENLNKELEEIEEYRKELTKLRSKGISNEFVDMLADKDRDEGLAIVKYVNSLSETEYQAISDNFKRLGDASKELSKELYSNVDSEEYTFEFKDNLKDNIADLKEYIDDLKKLKDRGILNDDMYAYIKSLGLKEGTALIKGLSAMTDAELKSIQDDFTEAGELAMDAGVIVYDNEVKTAAQILKDDIKNVLMSLPDEIKPYGILMMQQLAQGITEGSPQVLDAIDKSLFRNLGITKKKEYAEEFKDSYVKPEEMSADIAQTTVDAFEEAAENPAINKMQREYYEKQRLLHLGLGSNSPYFLTYDDFKHANEQRYKYFSILATSLKDGIDSSDWENLDANNFDVRYTINVFGNPDLGLYKDVDLTPTTKPVTDVESVDYDDPLESVARSLLDFSNLSDSVDTLNTTMTTTNTSISDMRTDISGLRSDFEQFASNIVDAFSNAQIVMDAGRLSSQLASPINGSLGRIAIQRSR